MVVKLAALTGQPQFRLYVPCKVACRHLKVVDSFRQNCERHAVPFARDTHKDCREIAVVSQFRNTMDWLLHGRTGQSQQHQQQHGGSGQPQQPVHTPVVPQLQGDPTFLYGGYGYRPPTFGYAWMNGASQPTSHAQLPTSAAAPESAPKPLSKSASAPDLQNPAAVQKKPPKKQASQSQHARPLGTPPLPRHQTKHLHSASVPPGTPGEESAANTPSSSRASTPPRRSAFDCYIGMAAA